MVRYGQPRRTSFATMLSIESRICSICTTDARKEQDDETRNQNHVAADNSCRDDRAGMGASEHRYDFGHGPGLIGICRRGSDGDGAQRRYFGGTLRNERRQRPIHNPWAAAWDL